MIWVSDRLKQLLREIRNSMGNLWARESFRAFLILFSVFLFSAIGFFIFERDAYEAYYHTPLRFFDAMWWAVVTTATVGYGDIIPLTDIGRMFGMITIFAGMGSFGLFAGVMSTFLASFGQREEDLRKARRTSNHVLVCGFNSNVLHLLSKLKSQYLQVLAVLSMKQANPKIVTICDVRQTRHQNHLQRAGVDYSFSEEDLSGDEFLHFIRSKYDLLIK